MVRAKGADSPPPPYGQPEIQGDFFEWASPDNVSRLPHPPPKKKKIA